MAIVTLNISVISDCGCALWHWFLCSDVDRFPLMGYFFNRYNHLGTEPVECTKHR